MPLATDAARKTPFILYHEKLGRPLIPQKRGPKPKAAGVARAASGKKAPKAAPKKAPKAAARKAPAKKKSK